MCCRHRAAPGWGHCVWAQQSRLPWPSGALQQAHPPPGDALGEKPSPLQQLLGRQRSDLPQADSKELTCTSGLKSECALKGPPALRRLPGCTLSAHILPRFTCLIPDQARRGAPMGSCQNGTARFSKKIKVRCRGFAQSHSWHPEGLIWATALAFLCLVVEQGTFPGPQPKRWKQEKSNSNIPFPNPQTRDYPKRSLGCPRRNVFMLRLLLPTQRACSP